MNLIEQNNVLKGLTDEHLQQEMDAPSGSAPPFLVLTEINRRKDMRQRYEGDQARRSKPTTVAQDLLMSRPPSAGLSAAPPMAVPAPAAAMQGLPAAMPPSAAPAFANGGIVSSGGGGLDYAAIEQRYADSLASLPEQRDRARAMALLTAGGAMLSGGSSNTLTNIGKGLTAGAGYYGDQLDSVDSRERDLMRDAIQLGQTRNSDELARLDQDWRKQRAAVEDEQFNRSLEASSGTAATQEFDYYDDLAPDKKAEYLRLNGSAAQTTDPLPEVFSNALDSALKQVPATDAAMQPVDPAARLAQAKTLAYQTILATYGPEAAAQFKLQAGLSDGDIVSGGPVGYGADAGDAVPYTDYF